MRLLVATTGSDGDVRPFIALALALVARGHDVLFSAPDYYASRVASYGLSFRKFGPPWSPADMEAVFARVLAAKTPLAQLSTVMDAVAEPERAAMPELLEMVSGVDAVIYPPILVAAAAAARAKNVPHVSVQLAPVHRARGYGPTGDDMGTFLNGIMWSLAAFTLRRATDAKLNTIVAAAGLPPWRDVLFSAASSSLLDLVAVSPHVLARDPAWPPASRVTGYWFLDEPDFVVDPALASFVEDARPIVIGFGSMIGFDKEATTRLVFDAVRDLDAKVVVQAGWAGLGAGDMPKNVHIAQFVPHAWLFPRASAVVHHGGAGTTAAAIRAGVPQAIVWHLGDQPVWGKRAKALGLSPGFVSHKKLSARWLRDAIDRMRGEPAFAAAASALGEQVRAEDGISVAVQAIEQTLAR